MGSVQTNLVLGCLSGGDQTVGAVQDLVEKFDVNSVDGFSDAMKCMSDVSEGELRYILAFSTEGQTPGWKKQHALAKAEIERRASKENEKLQKIIARRSGFWGLFGVIVGAVLQLIFSMIQTSPGPLFGLRIDFIRGNND